MIYAAAAVNFAILLIHIFGGGPPTVGPLMKSKDIGGVAKMTNYYCWHLVTITLFAMGACWVWYLLDENAREVAVLATGFSIAFMLWGLILVFGKKLKTLEMPQWILFGVSSLVSIGALWW